MYKLFYVEEFFFAWLTDKGSNLDHYDGVPCTRIAKVSLVPKAYVDHVGLITFNIGTDI